MLSLHETQGAFLLALRGNEPPAELLDMISEDGVLAVERLNIHRNNMTITLTESLRAIYPVTNRLIGADCFDALSRAFLKQHMPATPCLLDFGVSLSVFIAGSGLAESLPYLTDVAQFEWAWHRAYHAADAEPLAAVSLADVAAEDLPRLRLYSHPSRQFIASRFPVQRIWMANQQDDVPPVDLHAAGANLLLLRPDAEVKVLELSPAAFDFALDLDFGEPLATAADSAFRLDPTFDLTNTLADLLSVGAFCNFATINEELE